MDTAENTLALKETMSGADVLMQIGRQAADWWAWRGQSGGGAAEHQWQTGHGDKVHRNGGFILCVQELSLLGGELDDQTGPEIGF